MGIPRWSAEGHGHCRLPCSKRAWRMPVIEGVSAATSAQTFSGPGQLPSVTLRTLGGSPAWRSASPAWGAPVDQPVPRLGTSTRTAHTLYSGILAWGSRPKSCVSMLAGASLQWKERNTVPFGTR